MVKVKKCYNCSLNTLICECFNLFFYDLQPEDIEQIACSNNKYRTILRGSFSAEACLFLKKRLGCGGAFFKEKIEVQGKHRDKILSEIINL